jgi:signal transduction histidine kinase
MNALTWRAPLRSLRSRVFLASALAALLTAAVAIPVITGRVAQEADADLRRGLARSARLVDRQLTARAVQARLAAHLVADLPLLKAAVETGDAPTVAPIAGDYRARLQADFLAVADRRGRILAALGTGRAPATEALARALAGADVVTYESLPHGLLRTSSVPISLGREGGEVLGVLSVGFAVDDALARDFKTLTECDLVFFQRGRVSASTLPRAYDTELAQALRTGSALVRLGDAEYLGQTQAIADAGDAPVALVLRSRSDLLAVLDALRARLLAAAGLALLVAVLLSYVVARSVTGPLSALTTSMREMAARGELGGRVRLPAGWNDEEATLVARTLNALLESLARSQREAARRQRLAALGRLSAVIAHEVRNPLMVIKSSLPGLRQAPLQEAEAREIADDIDREVARLDRLVGDVLDYTREMRVDLAPTDLTALCREAVQAALAPNPGLSYALEVEPAAASVVTDAERLRTVLVALLTNAREALPAESLGAADRPAIVLATRVVEQRVQIDVDDAGPGIPEAERTQIFEPYFTTKRSGTGLGLAIARNVVEALGGTLEARARPGGGARLRIELPLAPPAR